MNPEIRFRVPQHVWDLASQTAESYGLSEQKGKTGGAAQFARGALYTALGLALPHDLHQMQSHHYAAVRQARLGETARESGPRLKVEIHHRIHPDFRKDSVLKSGRPVAARATTVLEFAQGELPEFLIPYVTLSEQGIPRAELNLEGRLSPRRHPLGELISEGRHCTLEELSACLARLRTSKAQRARRSQEHDTRSARGQEILERWAGKHGSELLKARLAGGFAWSELAQQEYAAHRLLELGLKKAVTRQAMAQSLGLPDVKLQSQPEPTLATMKRLAEIARASGESGGLTAQPVLYQTPTGEVYEAIRLRVETPMPGRPTFLLDPIRIPGGPPCHGL